MMKKVLFLIVISCCYVSVALADKRTGFEGVRFGDSFDSVKTSLVKTYSITISDVNKRLKENAEKGYQECLKRENKRNEERRKQEQLRRNIESLKFLNTNMTHTQITFGSTCIKLHSLFSCDGCCDVDSEKIDSVYLKNASFKCRDSKIILKGLSSSGYMFDVEMLFFKDKLFKVEYRAPVRLPGEYERVVKTDALAISKFLQKKYGSPMHKFDPSYEELDEDVINFYWKWFRNTYTIFSGVTRDSNKYYAVGVVYDDKLNKKYEDDLQNEDKSKAKINFKDWHK